MAAAATFFTSALGAFDPYSNSNMVVYWVSLDLAEHGDSF